MTSISNRIRDMFGSNQPQFGPSIANTIPWDKFSEVEIQGILKIHYEQLGYNVIWRHVEDPANENGIDLECIQQSTGKKIIIAVKKKPTKKDLGQLLQLAQYDAEVRIYLIINGSTQSFRDQIKNFKSQVVFWDENKLEDILDETELTFWLLLDNSYAFQALSLINQALIISTKDPSTQPFPRVNEKILNTLWDLKDRTVTLSKCCTLIQFLFENPNQLGKMDRKQIRELQIWCLNFLYKYSIISLYFIFKDLSGEMKSVLNHTYEHTQGRSNWTMLFSLRQEFIPGNILNLMEEKKQKNDQKVLGLNPNPYEKINLKEMDFNNATKEFRKLGTWADGLEYTIDFAFAECKKNMKIK